MIFFSHIYEEKREKERRQGERRARRREAHLCEISLAYDKNQSLSSVQTQCSLPLCKLRLVCFSPQQLHTSVSQLCDTSQKASSCVLMYIVDSCEGSFVMEAKKSLLALTLPVCLPIRCYLQFLSFFATVVIKKKKSKS